MVGLIVDLKDGQIRVNEAYYDFANSIGRGTFLINPRDNFVHDYLDLLIIPGGQDVYPLRYGEAPINSGTPNMDYEYFDMINLPLYIEKKVPIFGICRGLQTLNVAFGGSLHQHVDEPYSTYGRSSLVHYARDSKHNSYPVNSLHHQVINKLGDGFEITLEGYDLVGKEKVEVPLHIEAIRHTELPIAAVQFHPEELLNYKNAKRTIEFVAKEIENIIRPE